MDKVEINPFQQLYVSETTKSSDFVRLFSPYLVQHFLSLFQPGNVILRGTQGCGKTMLLSLLKPETRLAYFKANEEFPVPESMNGFISAGINLTRSDAVGIGQRPIIASNRETDRGLLPLYFADFVNYWIVKDLLESIKKIGDSPGAFNGIVDTGKLNRFARSLAAEECWFGYLNAATEFEELLELIKRRIYAYRDFNQFNRPDIPADISQTKTSIGQPVSRASVCLRETGVIKAETPVFIRIDQLEFLLESEEMENDLGRQYRRMINKALSTRDPAISYKIGTRTYAWADDIKVFGTEWELENERDYRIADLDEALRRKENSSTWILPDFAQDVFRRRLLYAGYEMRIPSTNDDDILDDVFGSGLAPTKAAIRYAGKSDPIRALRIEDWWPDDWKQLLTELFKEDPLQAKLASAWARQRETTKGARSRLELRPPTVDTAPWHRPYWRKERVRQALLQLSAHCAQRMYWGGKDQILNLSGTNILIFISMCQHIWDVFLRAKRGKKENTTPYQIREPISIESQSVGIYSASSHWCNKISEQPGGHKRRRFIDFIGTMFRHKLVNDLTMSYPGHNGFSVANEEWENEKSLSVFLRQAVNYGVLLEAPHTTKSEDRRQRTKWYLNPAYSPHFGIPETHVKEPFYVTAENLREWLHESDCRPLYSNNNLSTTTSDITPTSQSQLKLFGPIQ